MGGCSNFDEGYMNSADRPVLLMNYIRIARAEKGKREPRREMPREEMEYENRESRREMPRGWFICIARAEKGNMRMEAARKCGDNGSTNEIKFREERIPRCREEEMPR